MSWWDVHTKFQYFELWTSWTSKFAWPIIFIIICTDAATIITSTKTIHLCYLSPVQIKQKLIAKTNSEKGLNFDKTSTSSSYIYVASEF